MTTLTRERREELERQLVPAGLSIREWQLDQLFTVRLSGASIRDLLTALRRLGALENGDEISWLVENGSHQTMYRGMDQSGPFWTNDVNKAIRFARRADAEAFCSGDEDAWRVAEHMWCKPFATEGGAPSSTWDCSVCGRINRDTDTHCPQCEHSRMITRNGKRIPRADEGAAP